MKPIDRNPDVNLDKEQVPPSMTLIVGKNLMNTARNIKVPFGVASALNRLTYNSRPETIGLIIRDADVERFNKALEKKTEKRLLNKTK